VANPAPILSDEQLERNFADIAPALTPDYALLEANKCLFCEDAPCTRACPTHIDVPAFIKKIATGNLRGSARVILEANPFGHSCARACPVEVLCEGACVLNDRDEQPIKIALLQRHATDYVLERKVKLFEPGKPNGKNVGVIGAGPAGLSCARDLRRLGYAVTVFEAKPQPGGLNTYGIAEYKLRSDVALAEVQDIVDLGVELRMGVAIGRDIPFDRLLADYDAVFVGVGLGKTKALGIPGEGLEGVVDALTFIEHLKTHPYRETRVGRRVVVIGAGKIGLTLAESLATRKHDVKLVESERRIAGDVMPSFKWRHTQWVQELAIPVMTSTRVAAIGDGGVTIVNAKNETSFLAADTVIAAVAARPNQELFHELEWMVDEIHGCGDALVPLGLTRAIHDGYRLGARL